jgi:hypothetical protein
MRGVLVPRDGCAIDLELHDPAVDVVELLRLRLHLHADARRGFVDEVDRLVREKAVGDVAVREHGRRHQRRVLDLDVVVLFVLRAQAAQDRDRVLDGRLAHHHGLEGS